MEQEHDRLDRSFIRLPRYLRDDYLNKKLKLKELIVLIWLWWNANPNNGVIKVGYQGIFEDLCDLLRDKNEANKITLRLRKKQYIWFPPRQGLSGSFLIEIDRYPKSDKTFKDLTRRFLAEVSPAMQKLDRDRKALGNAFSVTNQFDSRSSNNKNENKNNSE